jgi:hypothetical protein
VEPLAALASAQGGRGGEEEAKDLAQEVMRRELAFLEAFFSRLAPSKGRELAALFASIVHGAHMLEKHVGGYRAEDLLREGIRVFARGVEER